MPLDLDGEMRLRAGEPYVMDAVLPFQEAERDSHAEAVHRRLDHGTRSVGQGEVEVVSAPVVVLFQLLRPPGHAEGQPHGADLVERLVGRHAGEVNLAADGEVVFHCCSRRYQNNADGDK